MELYKELLQKFLDELDESDTSIAIIDKIIENRCYQALSEIIKIIRASELEDAECFKRIEKIICELEKVGSHGDFRYDFG